MQKSKSWTPVQTTGKLFAIVIMLAELNVETCAECLMMIRPFMLPHVENFNSHHPPT